MGEDKIVNMKRLLLLFVAISLSACTASENIEDQQQPQKEIQKPEEVKSPRTSTLEMKMKCQEYGEENYQFMSFDDGYSDFTFFYSPVLDTCVGEREDFGPGVMIKYELFDMFGAGTTKWLAGYRYASWCEGEDCLTLEEYRRKKSELLGE